jgi:hypothetical protein
MLCGALVLLASMAIEYMATIIGEHAGGLPTSPFYYSSVSWIQVGVFGPMHMRAGSRYLDLTTVATDSVWP